MKKLIIALAAVGMAVAANAAAAPWKATITNIYTGNTTDKFAGYVYILDADAYSMQTVYDNFANKTWTSADNLDSVKAGKIQATAGAAANKTFDYGDGGVQYDFYAVILDGENLYFSNLLTDKTASSSSTAATLAFGTQLTGSQKAATAGFQGASAWSSFGGSSVPEPTSGLLVLLGVAGLALRRRA